MTNAVIDSFNGSNNVYNNAHGFRCFVALFIAFIIWSIVELLYGLFGGILHPRHRATNINSSSRRNPTQHDNTSVEYGETTSTTVVPRSKYHTTSERITNAFRYFFPSLATVIILNDITNGITQGFEVLVWIVLILGIIWAFARGAVRRFADGLLIPIIVLFFAMWALGLRNRVYL